MRGYKNFIAKLLSLAMIFAVLFYYQSVASVRARAVAENEAAVAEVEEYNAALLAAQSESPYNDGTFTGTADGFGGAVTVSVTVADGRIAEVTVTEHSGEDPVYYSQAEALTKKIVSAQSFEVDTVSGATYSSLGILNAVRDALSKAVK